MAIFGRSRANEQMNHHFAGLIGAMTVLIALALTSPVPVAGQARWSQPRTPDGQPDLQGVWSNATLTPLERPAAFAGREFLTEKEQAEKEGQLILRDQKVADSLETARKWDQQRYDDGRGDPQPPRSKHHQDMPTPS